MDKDLMEKEVLCILDTRQIQRFIFRSNSYVDTLGGSDLISHILEDGIRHALKNMDPPLKETEVDLSLDPDGPIPFFEDRSVLFQLITCAAGNAMFLARTGRLAQKIIRKVSRYYLDHAYSLNLAAAAVEKTEDFGYDIFALYKKLNGIKTSAVISNPLGALPVVLREERTGEPVIGLDEKNGDYISMSSWIRRREAAKRGEVIGLTELCTTKGVDGKAYRAVLHVDGNNLGITIGRMLQQTSDYQTGIRLRRRVNGNIQRQYTRIMKNTIADLRAFCASLKNRESDFAHEFQVVHNNGDDVNCMCNADLAFPFLNFFFKNLENTFIGEAQGQKIPLYCCAGVCFVTEESSFHTAFMMAEECCSSAKKTAKLEKNLRNGLAGNWIDFQICENQYFQELDMFRERSFVTDTHVNLSLRPYCLDRNAEDTEYAYGKLLQRVRALHRLQQRYGWAYLNRLRENYLLDRFIFMEGVHLLQKDGMDLEAMLGAPFCRDENKNLYASWYDALKVVPFLPETAMAEPVRDCGEVDSQ